MAKPMTDRAPRPEGMSKPPMSQDEIEAIAESYADEDDYCAKCDGEGWILTCCDDICHGLGYCMHGDGMEMCACNTFDEPPSNAPASWKWTPRR